MDCDWFIYSDSFQYKNKSIYFVKSIDNPRARFPGSNTMQAGTYKIDITPSEPVWMDGMIRDRKSEGVHDRIFARALVLSSDGTMSEALALVSVEVCGLKDDITGAARRATSEATEIPCENIIVAATHTHSGPSALGFFNPAETEYVAELSGLLSKAVIEACNRLAPAAVGCGRGNEDTISHYRRLLTVDGTVIMNWEEHTPESIICPLGDVDTEVGVLLVTSASDNKNMLGITFNHAGHPNIMSGDNYLISGDYPGRTMNEIESYFGAEALFLNGAQGTMDIDGLRDRDWDGVERAGGALAGAVIAASRGITPDPSAALRTAHIAYTLPRRIISPEEMAWADSVLGCTGGNVASQADGVGDDYKALLFKRLHALEHSTIDVEQTCFAVGDTAFVSFPGELFTEIGIKIKLMSPFPHTFIIGLANGEIGYVPTKRAIREGGYAVDTREAGDEAVDIIMEKSLEILQNVYEQ